MTRDLPPIRRVAALALTSAVLGLGVATGVAAPASAADFAVTDETSLRSAVANAGDGDTITFATGIPPIVLTIGGGGDLADITHDVEILGNGAILNGGGFAPLHISGGAHVVIRDLTVTGSVDDGIDVEDSSLDLYDVTVSDNGEDGLDVENDGAAFQITATDCDFGLNVQDGVDALLDNGAGITITGGTANGNGEQGLDLDLDGAGIARVTDVTANDNDWDGFGFYTGDTAQVIGTRLNAADNLQDGAEIGVFGSSRAELHDGLLQNNLENGINTRIEGGSLEVTGTRILDNTLENVYFDALLGAATFTGVTISGSATFEGIYIGEIDSDGDGSLAVRTSTISGNTEEGIEAYVSGTTTITVDRSTISGNGGPGLLLELSDTASATVVDSTISDNTPDCAAGIDLDGDDTASFELLYSTVVNASTACAQMRVVNVTTTIANAIVAGGASDLQADADLTIDYSLIQTPHDAGVALDIAAGTGNLTDIDPLLGPLAANGGPTLTRLPLAGSPVIDAGDPAPVSPPATDQRGLARITGIAAEMGAVELQRTLPATGVDPLGSLAAAAALLAAGAIGLGITGRRPARLFPR